MGLPVLPIAVILGEAGCHFARRTRGRGDGRIPPSHFTLKQLQILRPDQGEMPDDHLEEQQVATPPCGILAAFTKRGR